MSNPFELLVGPLLILIGIALILFGVFSAQVYFYWFTYEEDSLAMRSLVLGLWVLETCHTCFCLHLLYTYFVLDIGNPEGLLYVVWSAGATVFLEILIVSGAQGFYIHRIWQLSEHNILATAIPGTFLFARICFGFATGSLLYRYRTWPEFREHTGSLFTLNCGLALAAFVDLITTATLTYYLRKNKSNFKRTRHLIQKLIFYTINTGALTMVFSIAILFMFNFATTSLMFAGMVEVVSKLYANSMLAMVNARKRIKNDVMSSDGGINSIPLNITSGGGRSYDSRHQTSNRMRVNIFKEVTATSDKNDVSHSPSKQGFDLA